MDPTRLPQRPNLVHCRSAHALGAGPPYRARSRRGLTRLGLAVRGGSLPLVKRLIAEGAPVNELDRHGLPPLVYACWDGHWAIARLLVARGATVKGSHPLGTDLYLWAMGHWKRVDADWSRWRSNAAALPLVRLLLASGANVNDPTKFGGNALYVAASHSNLAVAKVLLAAGADVNAANRFGYTALIVSAGMGDAATVELLLRYGADPTMATRRGRTALWFAEKHRHAAVVALLRNAAPTAGHQG